MELGSIEVRTTNENNVNADETCCTGCVRDTFPQDIYIVEDTDQEECCPCEYFVSCCSGCTSRHCTFFQLRLWQVVLYLAFLIALPLVVRYGLHLGLEYDYVKGAVLTKVRGTLVAGSPNQGGQLKTWDAADIVVPPRGPDEFFVMTHVLPTLTQRQEVCEENPRVEGIRCNTSADCQEKKGAVLPGSHGAITGMCVPSTFFTGVKVCQIDGWCPVEHDEPDPASEILHGTENFTVLIRVDAEYPRFEKFGSNLRTHGSLGEHDDDVDKLDCFYVSSTSQGRFCPKFKLGTIVEGANVPYESITEKGAVIRIDVNFDCDLDLDVKDCYPTYTFKRMDVVNPGYSLRFPRYQGPRQEMKRELTKAYGIRFLVVVEGRGHQYDSWRFIKDCGSFLSYHAAIGLILHYVVYKMYGVNITDVARKKSTLRDCLCGRDQ